MPDMTKLVDRAMNLRGQAPEAWDEFLAAVRDYSAQVTAEMVRCPPELLSRAQGMAIQAGEISGVLNDAPRLYEKMMQHKMGARNGQEARPQGRQNGY